MKILSGWFFELLHLCLIKIVASNVIVELLLKRFVNKNGLNFDGKYCDDIFGTNPCDMLFEICVKHGGVPTDPCKGKVVTKDYINQNEIDFTKDPGQPKNLVRREFKEPYRNNIFITVTAEDVDFSANDLVDEFQHELDKVPSPNETVAKFQKFVRSGIHKSGSILEYEIKVYCSLNYFGKNCTTYCKVEKDENYVCNDLGLKTCKPHWFGNRCNISCKPNDKEHYTCDKITGQKICLADYYGADCLVYCNSKAQKYICNNVSGEKQCIQNFYGKNCTTFCNASATNYYCNQSNGNIICHKDRYGKSCRFCKNNENKDNYKCNTNTGEKECYQNYYGEHCTTYCNTYNNSRNYICKNTTGERECFKYYYGENCTTSCTTKNGLANYICNEITGEKVCFDSYYGENCTIYYNNLNGTTKLSCNNITCQLECFSDYYGDNCSTFCMANNKNYTCDVTGSTKQLRPTSFSLSSAQFTFFHSSDSGSVVQVAPTFVKQFLQTQSTAFSYYGSVVQIAPTSVKQFQQSQSTAFSYYDILPTTMSTSTSSNTGCISDVIYHNSTGFQVICRCNNKEVGTNLTECYKFSELSIVSIVGCINSATAIFLTIITYILFRNLQTISQKIFINSCFSMLFLILTFLIGIKRTYQPRVCHAVSVLLHYFTLTTFGWMSVEFLSMYRNVFRLYQGSRFFWTMWVFTWGFSAIASGVTSSFTKAQFNGLNNFCYASGSMFIALTIVPISCVVVLVVILLVKIICKMKMNQSMGDLPTRVRTAFMRAILLGSTWLFGVLAAADFRDSLQWVFSILNSLLGICLSIYAIKVLQSKKDCLPVLSLRKGSERITQETKA